jgi:hypothetical protein
MWTEGLLKVPKGKFKWVYSYSKTPEMVVSIKEAVQLECFPKLSASRTRLIPILNLEKYASQLHCKFALL